MDFTDRLREELKIDEGCKYEVYLDHLGLPTFGIGHLITKDDPEYQMGMGTPVDEIRVNEVFEQDINVTIGECRKLFDDCLEGGARALQINNGKIQKGFNADLISLPNTNNELDGLEDDKILDYWIFSSRENDVQKLWNKGKCLVENGKHLNFDDIQSNYRKTIKNLQEKL